MWESEAIVITCETKTKKPNLRAWRGSVGVPLAAVGDTVGETHNNGIKVRSIRSMWRSQFFMIEIRRNGFMAQNGSSPRIGLDE